MSTALRSKPKSGCTSSTGWGTRFSSCLDVSRATRSRRNARPFFPILSFFSPECEWEQNRAFFYPPDDPDELFDTLENNAQRVATEIFAWALRNKIDVLLSENASALPCHLSMGLGIKLAVDSMDIPVVSHDHDYAWERGTRYDSPFQEITDLVHDAFPLRSAPHVRHAVINSAAQAEIKRASTSTPTWSRT